MDPAKEEPALERSGDVLKDGEGGQGNVVEALAPVETSAPEPRDATQLMHDFNNVLTVIVGGLRVLEGENDGARRSLVIEGMRETLKRAAEDFHLPTLAAALATPRVQPRRREGRVLVVEDGGGVASMACRMLDRLGYSALHVGSAEAALDVLSKDTSFTLVFSDVFMPGITGIELADTIKERWPELPVLLTSGFSGEDYRGKHAMLAKPYSLEDLAQTLERVIAD